jgi:undecaprenyl-diphosphatase
MKHKRLVIFCTAIIAFILALIFDSQILAFIELINCPCADSFFSVLMFIEKEIIFYPLVILSTLIILFTKDKKKILPYIISLAIVAIIGLSLKAIVARPRPNNMSIHSFPSGHTALAFASLSFFKNKILKVIWIILACVFVLARVWTNMHYLSDVIAGALLGYYIPIVITKIINKKMAQKNRRKKEK